MFKRLFPGASEEEKTQNKIQQYVTQLAQGKGTLPKSNHPLGFNFYTSEGKLDFNNPFSVLNEFVLYHYCNSGISKVAQECAGLSYAIADTTIARFLSTPTPQCIESNAPEALVDLKRAALDYMIENTANAIAAKKEWEEAKNALAIVKLQDPHINRIYEDLSQSYKERSTLNKQITREEEKHGQETLSEELILLKKDQIKLEEEIIALEHHRDSIPAQQQYDQASAAYGKHCQGDYYITRLILPHFVKRITELQGTSDLPLDKHLTTLDEHEFVEALLAAQLNDPPTGEWEIVPFTTEYGR